MDIDEHLMVKAFNKCFSLLERIDARLISLEKREFGMDGERLLDNQDLCQVLNVDKKTLERYWKIHSYLPPSVHFKVIP